MLFRRLYGFIAHGNVLDGDWHVLRAMVFVIASSPLWLRCAWQVAIAASYTGFYPFGGDGLQQCVGRRVACAASHGVCCCFVAVMAS